MTGRLKFKVEIQKMATGEVRFYESECNPYIPSDYGWGDCPEVPEFPEFIWTEGNYACDCNRRSFFAEAGGEDDPEDDTCGDTEFRINRVIMEDGRECLVHALTVDNKQGREL